MPFQKGNKLAVGHGRKSLPVELDKYQRLWEKWTAPGFGDEVAKRMGTGKESLEDVFFALGFKENTDVLKEIFKKLHPDIKQPEEHKTLIINISEDNAKRFGLIARNPEESSE